MQVGYSFVFICVLLFSSISSIIAFLKDDKLTHLHLNSVHGIDKNGGFAPHAPTHNNNWAVLVSTSKYWFNYRHNANTMSLYRTVKQLGIPDSNIILMLAEDVSCSPRNVAPATVFNNAEHSINLYSEDGLEVDYRGSEVTVENFIRLLTNRHPTTTPRSKRLLSDDKSNIFIYMTGHGGDEFLKFQDNEVLSAQDLADSLSQMHKQKRYNEVFLMVDTCQASTLLKRITAPNVITIGSAGLGENSYSHSIDPIIANTVIDRFTYYTLDFFERRHGQASIMELLQSYKPGLLAANPEFRTTTTKSLSSIPVTSFFGSVLRLHATPLMYGSASQIYSTDSTLKNVRRKLPQLDFTYKKNSLHGGLYLYPTVSVFIIIALLAYKLDKNNS